MFKNVVLPEPDGPVTATKSPSSMRSEKSRKACVCTVSVRYVFETLVIVSMRSSLDLNRSPKP